MQDFFRIALSIEQHIESGKLWLQTPYCILLYPAAKLFIYNHCLWYIIKQENQWGVALLLWKHAQVRYQNS